MYIAVCDDERLFIDDICYMLTEIERENNFKAHISYFTSPRTMIEASEVFDVALLDVEMPSMSGIEAARRLRMKNPDLSVIFITCRDFYLDDAFDVGAFRYITKPITRLRLEECILKAMTKKKARPKFVPFSIGKKPVEIDVKDIIFVTPSARKTQLQTVNGALLCDETYSEVVRRLMPFNFIESHSSYCVNMRYVAYYNKESVTLLCRSNEFIVHMSRRCYNNFVNGLFSMAEENI